jgi:hypothetical protein
MDSAIGKFIQRIKSGGMAIESNAPPIASILHEHTGEDDTRRVIVRMGDEVSRLSQNPDLMAAKVNSSLSGIQEIDPELTKAIVSKTVPVFQAVNNILEQARPERDQLQPFIQDETSLPGKQDADQAMRMASAALDPMSAVENAASGHGDPQAIAAVKQLYPRLWSRMTFAMTELLSQITDRLSSTARQEVADWLGVPVDRATSMDFARRAQEAYKRQGGPQASGQQGPGNPEPTRTAQLRNLGSSFAAARQSGTQQVDAGLSGA